MRWTLGRALAAAFLIVCLPTCLELAVITPLGRVADEHAHARRADSIGRGDWTGHRELTENGTPVEGVTSDSALSLIAHTSLPTLIDRARADEIAAMPWMGPSFQLIGNVALYAPPFYLPAALALRVSRDLLGFGPAQAFRAARIVNALVFAALGAAALLLARRAEPLFFCVLAVPMSLSLGGSLNQDGLIIAASVLAAALLTGHEQDAGRRRILLAFLVLTAILLAKPPNAPMALILLLPVLRGARARWRWRALAPRAAMIAVAAGLAAAWIAAGLAHVSTPVPTPPAEAGPLWPGPSPAVFDTLPMAEQLKVLLAKPSRTVKLPLDVVLHQPRLPLEIVGVLGELSIALPAWLYPLWAVGFAAAALATLARRREGGAEPGWADLLVVVVAAAGSFELVAISQYLSWTPVGAAAIEGVQGRYVLPLIPVLALGLPALSLPGRRLLAGFGAAVPVLAGLAGMVVVPVVIVRAYYLS